MYEVDKVYEFDGKSRRVIGKDGAGNLITAPADFEVDIEAKVSPEGQIKLEEMKLQLAEREKEIEELKKSAGDKTAIAAEIFSLFDAIKLPGDELKAIAGYLGYTLPEDPSKAEIIKIIKKD